MEKNEQDKMWREMPERDPQRIQTMESSPSSFKMFKDTKPTLLTLTENMKQKK